MPYNLKSFKVGKKNLVQIEMDGSRFLAGGIEVKVEWIKSHEGIIEFPVTGFKKGGKNPLELAEIGEGILDGGMSPNEAIYTVLKDARKAGIFRGKSVNCFRRDYFYKVRVCSINQFGNSWILDEERIQYSVTSGVGNFC